MFCGKISLRGISASRLPWSNENKMDQKSDLRPYLAISVDAEHKKNVGQEELSQRQEVTRNPAWSGDVDIDDIEDNELLQFTVYHNSKIRPHLPVAHMDLDIATLREHLDKSGEKMIKFQEKFSAGGTIDFFISMEADDSHRLQRGENVVKIFPKKGHKFKKNYFDQLTFCYHCKNMIWGLTMYQQKALRCEICLVPVHKRCYQRLLDNCVLAKKLNPEVEKKEIKLGNQHTFRNTQLILPRQCAVHGQWMATGRKALVCTQCGLHVHLECREKIGANCGVNMAELALRYEDLKEKKAKEKEEEEAKKKLNEARKHYNEKKKTVKKGRPSLGDFEILKTLGHGAFGKVLLTRHKDGKLYALKTVKKNEVMESEDDITITMTERNVLRLGKECRFITELYCSFQTKDRLFFAMEFLEGGDLFFHIINDKKFSEERSRFYSAEVTLAFLFLHERGIVYRDLKLDNVMLTSTGHTKLADFGMCKENISEENLTKTFCGTPNFIAPEIIREESYGFSADWWTLGVLTYEMLLGRTPFHAKDSSELYLKIKNEEPRYPSALSPCAKDFIRKLLVKNPQTRLAGEAVKSHPFFESIDWDALSAGEVTPPFVPDGGDPLDTTNFEDQFTTLDTNFSVIEMDKNLAELCETSFPDFSFY